LFIVALPGVPSAAGLAAAMLYGALTPSASLRQARVLDMAIRLIFVGQLTI